MEALAFFLVLGTIIYLITLAGRLVRAVEKLTATVQKIADNYEGR